MNKPIPDPRVFRYADLVVGRKETGDYPITPEVYAHFLGAFGDYNPLHVDDAYARQCGFGGKVMHGSLLNGFLSHFVGMVFPGRASLLLTVDLRFSEPSYLGDMIRLEAVVSQKLDARRIVVLDVVLHNATRDLVAARGRVQVMMREEA